MSAEADIYPLNATHKADAIDAAIGEGSRFHETYGYYAQGVGPETACLPAGWDWLLEVPTVHRCIIGGICTSGFLGSNKPAEAGCCNKRIGRLPRSFRLLGGDRIQKHVARTSASYLSS